MLVINLPGKFSLRIPNTLSSDLLSGVPITPPLIFVMSCLQGRAIFLTPTLPLMKIHQTSNPNPTPMATFTVDDLIGRSFLLPSGQDSHNKTRATVTKKVEELDQDSASRGEHIKFVLKLNNQEDVEQVITYNQLLDYLEKDESQFYWSFKEDIIAHQCPLTKEDPHYKGRSYNVMIE